MACLVKTVVVYMRLCNVYKSLTAKENTVSAVIIIKVHKFRSYKSITISLYYYKIVCCNERPAVDMCMACARVRV